MSTKENYTKYELMDIAPEWNDTKLGLSNIEMRRGQETTFYQSHRNENEGKDFVWTKCFSEIRVSNSYNSELTSHWLIHGASGVLSRLGIINEFQEISHVEQFPISQHPIASPSIVEIVKRKRKRQQKRLVLKLKEPCHIATKCTESLFRKVLPAIGEHVVRLLVCTRHCPFPRFMPIFRRALLGYPLARKTSKFANFV